MFLGEEWQKVGLGCCIDGREKEEARKELGLRGFCAESLGCYQGKEKYFVFFFLFLSIPNLKKALGVE